ncbi:TerD family protein [Streptomyces bambusae]|uniref:TerD family protein n=1 Tax=Streptomyces bambusae TaxID=1550616 RepID=UPI001CFEBEB7|nr:TerD family protein [Streptomyces bambusae]MCB5166798.1 TerD family protein [Streptomyces bambusae]
MTAELVRGQNHPLPHTQVEIRISAGTPVLAGVLLGDEAGRMLPGADAAAHPGRPRIPGAVCPVAAAAGQRIEVDLAAVPDAAHRVGVLLALPPGGPARFGTVAAPHLAVLDAGGTEAVGFTLTGLDTESAVIAVELYRRQGAWKVRAVGQGYADGLAGLFADHGLDPVAAAALAASAVPAAAEAPPQAVRTLGGTTAGPQGPAAATEPDRGREAPGPVPVSGVPYPGTPGPAPAEPPAAVSYEHPRRARTQPPAPAPQPAPARPGEQPRPVAGDANGWTMEERLHNQVWGMFEDLARVVAAYRSAVAFAEDRMDRELDQALADPRDRLGGGSGAAREAAQARHDDLVLQARAVLDRDLAQLTAEAEVVEPALPAAFAGWDHPLWQDHRLPSEPPMSLRLGDLHLPERPDLRIPMLVRLPLERGLWIDSGRTGSEAAMAMDTDRLRRLALDTAVAHAARLLAVHPAGGFRVHAVDAAGAGAAALEPLRRAGLLAGPPATGAAGVSELLARLTERVDLVQMALGSGAAESLPPHVDTAPQLLIVHDFPHGFDDRAVTRLRYLADEGPAVGVHLLMVADRDEASAYGPLLDPLWKSLLRLSPVPDDHLADPWVGHAWTFEPSLPPAGSAVLEQVLARIAEER